MTREQRMIDAYKASKNPDPAVIAEMEAIAAGAGDDMLSYHPEDSTRVSSDAPKPTPSFQEELHDTLVRMLSNTTPYKQWRPEGVEYQVNLAMEAITKAVLAARPNEKLPSSRIVYDGQGELTGAAHEINGYNDALDAWTAALTERKP